MLLGNQSLCWHSTGPRRRPPSTWQQLRQFTTSSGKWRPACLEGMGKLTRWTTVSSSLVLVHSMLQRWTTVSSSLVLVHSMLQRWTTVSSSLVLVHSMLQRWTTVSSSLVLVHSMLQRWTTVSSSLVPSMLQVTHQAAEGSMHPW